MFFKSDARISRPIIGSLVLFILLSFAGMKHERSLAASPQWTRVNIEVLPGERSKFIDASTRSIVPVAILSSMDFDASTVSPVSVRLAGAPITKNKKGQLRGFLADVNGDGRIDLVVYVSVYSLNLDPGTSEALLTANTFDGQSVSGSQQVSFRAPVVQDSPLYAAASLEGSVSNSSIIVIGDDVVSPPTTAKPYPSNITVSGQPTITKVTVSISNYSHTFPDDVDILLVGPTGATCLLMADCGGSDFVNNVNLTFDENFPSLPDGSQITTGTYKPTKGTCIGGGDNCAPSNFPSTAPSGPYGTTLSVFNGTNPNGTWQLYVIDDSAGDEGVISGGWSLTINPTTGPPKGTDTAGLYDPAAGAFFLRNSNSSAPADLVFGYGPAGAGWIPIVGDWNGDGVDTIGLYNPTTSTFFLRNSNSSAVADLVFSFGPAGAGWIPIAGDWNGDGVDTIGLYDPATSTFFLSNSNSSAPASIVFTYGPAGAGWIPMAGDWDGDGVATIGLYNPATSQFFLSNSNSSAPASTVFTYGPAGAGWKPLAGDWNGDGTDTIGLYNPATSQFFLRNSNSSAPADIVFGYGPAGAGWIPIVGDWDGL